MLKFTDDTADLKCYFWTFLKAKNLTDNKGVVARNIIDVNFNDRCSDLHEHSSLDFKRWLWAVWHWNEKVFVFDHFFLRSTYFCSQPIFFGAIFFKPQLFVLKRSFLRFLAVGGSRGGAWGGGTLSFHQNLPNISDLICWVDFDENSRYPLPKHPRVTLTAKNL